MDTVVKFQKKKKELSPLASRFMRVLEEKSYTGYRLSKDFPKLLEGTVTKIRTARVEPSEHYLNAILEKFPDVSRVWLLTGEGDIFNNEETSPIKTQQPTGFYYPDVSASAGLESGMQNDELKRIPINIPGWEKGVDFINVYGDSMYPKFCSGEIIGIKELESQYMNYGYAYVIILNDGQVYLKYIKKGKDSEHWLLASENPRYEPKEYHISLIKRIFIIKGVITKTTM